MSWKETRGSLPKCRTGKKTKAEGKKTKWKIRRKAAGDYKTKWVAACIRGNLLFPKAFQEFLP